MQEIMMKFGSQLVTSLTALEAVESATVYRVEAWLTVDGEERAGIYSNPIYVR
jgi:hypothetical protein